MTDCSVIGVLDDGPAGLTAEAVARIGAAKRVIGARRMLEGCADLMAPNAEPLDLTGRIDNVPGWIEASIAAGDPVVVLATGDPLCFGIGGLLARRLDPAKLHILPNRSTVQLACARFRIPWENARWLSVHHRDSGDWTPGATPDHGLYPLAQALRRETLLAVLTSPANGPARIARLLLAEGLGEDFDLHVAERLLMPGERLIGAETASVIAGMDFADWPDPDAVFIGGSSGRLAEMLDLVIGRLRPDGRLVLALVAVENLTLALAALDRLGAHWDLTQIQAARSLPIIGLHRLQAENPVWLVQARAPSL